MQLNGSVDMNQPFRWKWRMGEWESGGARERARAVEMEIFPCLSVSLPPLSRSPAPALSRSPNH